MEEVLSSEKSDSNHGSLSKRLVLTVWIWLLILTGVEVFLAYVQLGLVLMLTLLMGLSLVKAGLIIAYFMHLRFERFSLTLTLIPMLLACVILMVVFFLPDGARVMELKP